MRRVLIPAALGLFLAVPAPAQEVHQLTGFQAQAARKSQPVSCWAACVAMLLKSAGHTVSQKTILDRNDAPGDGFRLEEIEAPMNFDFGRKGSVTITPRAATKPLKRIDIINSFDQNRFIVAGRRAESLEGAPDHPVVIYGYRIDLMNQMHLLIYDPWPRGTHHEFEMRENWGWEGTLYLTLDSPDSTERDTWYKNAAHCVNLTSADVQWGSSLQSGMLYFTLSYENTCDRPVRCQVTVQSGNQADGFALAGTAQWILRQSRSQIFVLMPGGSYTVRGGLKWSRAERFTPKVLYPDPFRGENPNLIRCEYLPRRAAD